MGLIGRELLDGRARNPKSTCISSWQAFDAPHSAEVSSIFRDGLCQNYA